ncbi:MAG: hypothetical protein M3511_14995, partial [Deinococcota bacterium]|nr:hypothetical protein [Deinococcota bacterium]
LPGAGGNIAYILHNPNCNNCQWQLYLADQSDDKKTGLLASGREIDSIAVSLDGNTVVFAMKAPDDKNFEIYRMIVDAKSITRLTTTGYDEKNVSMSANGNTLVWEGSNAAGKRAVFIRTYSGATFTESILSVSINQLQPSVSSNGRYIALVRPVASAHYVLRYDRTSNSYVTAFGSTNVLEHPSVSSDGVMVAGLEHLPNGDRVLTRNLTTGIFKQPVFRSSGLEHPHITADGNFLTYSALQSGSWQVFTINLTTGQTAQAATSTATTLNRYAPFWQKAVTKTSSSSDEDPPPAAGEGLSLRISGGSSGRSSRYIGANGGGSVPPNISDIRDLGLTTYRLFGGMQTFEPTDDDGNYGSPAIADMKRVLAGNPSRVDDFVNWAAFDKNMRGTGSILRELYTVPGMEPIMVLRNSANWGTFWVPRMSVTGAGCKTSSGQTIVWPQFSSADWNEWWQHVFAVVYWINVRNGSSMRVDRWSAFNEPNQQKSPHSQGWCGTKAQYLEFVKYTNDAIDFVYKTYLRDRPRWVHGGVLSTARGWEDWFRPMLRNSSSFHSSMFDVIDMHPYYANMSTRVSVARRLTRESGVASEVQNYPIWASEMGEFKSGQWDNLPLVINSLVNNLIGGSTPGDGRVEGAALWRMYDGSSDSWGLIKRDGSRRAGFYAMRLAVMALNGGKVVYPTQLATANSNISAITTREGSGGYNLLMTNRSSTAYAVNADVSALLASGKAD